MGREDLGALPQTLPNPFLKERVRDPKNFPEKGVPPSNGPMMSDRLPGRGYAILRKILRILKTFF